MVPRSRSTRPIFCKMSKGTTCSVVLSFTRMLSDRTMPLSRACLRFTCLGPSGSCTSFVLGSYMPSLTVSTSDKPCGVVPGFAPLLSSVSSCPASASDPDRSPIKPLLHAFATLTVFPEFLSSTLPVSGLRIPSSMASFSDNCSPVDVSLTSRALGSMNFASRHCCSVSVSPVAGCVKLPVSGSKTPASIASNSDSGLDGRISKESMSLFSSLGACTSKCGAFMVSTPSFPSFSFSFSA